MNRKALQVSPKMRRLPRGDVYGPALAEILSLLQEDVEIKNPVYTFTNAFMDKFKRSRPTEYDDMTDAEDIAWTEKGMYEMFVKEAVKAFPGLRESDLPDSKSVFYVLRSRLRKTLSKQSNLRSKVIRLAHDKPELRQHLLPLLKRADQLSETSGEEEKLHQLLGVPAGENIKDHFSAFKAVKQLVDKVGKVEALSVINGIADIKHDKFFDEMQRIVNR